MNDMTYKGYAARVEFDPRDNVFWGKVLGLPDSISITFEGDTVAQLTQDFHNAIDFYLLDCANTGREPTKPASGKLMLRVPPELHGSALVAAKTSGKSLNQWAIEVFSKALHA
jgi:predicted HicB family RNase H-like nuclease